MAKTYTLTYKRLAELCALYFEIVSLKEGDPHYAFLVNFIGWAYSNKYQDLTKLPEYAEIEKELNALETLIKKAAKAKG